MLKCILGELRTCAGSTASKNFGFAGLEIYRLALHIRRPEYVTKGRRIEENACASQEPGPRPAVAPRGRSADQILVDAGARPI